MPPKRINEPTHPHIVPIVQERTNQQILAGEVTVESDLRHPSLGNHPINAGSPDPIPVEQVMGGPQKPITRR